MKKIFNLLVVGLTLILCMANFSVEAADYPTKPITIINPLAAGGARDIQSRAFASVAEKLLGQPVVCINKTGASGMLGLIEGAHAAPDGYTLTSGATGDIMVFEWEMASGRKPEVTRNDFITIGSFVLSPSLIAVPYNSPWKTLADLINDAKAKPDHYAFASGGMYQTAHIATEIFIKATGLKLRHVPYKGGGEVVPALVGGHVDFAMVSVSSVIPLVRGNKLRILAVQSNTRYTPVKDIPTVKELGVDAEFYTWNGIWAPQKTPMLIVEKLRGVIKKVVEDKSFIKIAESNGDVVTFMNGDELAKHMDWETEKFKKLFKQLIEEKK